VREKEITKIIREGAISSGMNIREKEKRRGRQKKESRSRDNEDEKFNAASMLKIFVHKMHISETFL
jgi:hypothetical protein